MLSQAVNFGKLKREVNFAHKEKMMRFPEFLKDNDTIGLVAPSYGCATAPRYRLPFEKALSRFESLGYKTNLGPNCYATEGIGKSNTPEKCADEINDYFINRDCGMIFSVGGGETMCEDMSFVDFEGIKNAAPKWYAGYSDNANLTFLLPVLTDTAALYCSNAPSFGSEKLHKSHTDALDFLAGKKLKFTNYDGWEKESLKSDENPHANINITEPYSQINVLPAGCDSFSGRMLGGCLDVLVTLCGTRFDRVKEFNERYKDDGTVWFLEACDLNPMGVMRALWQLDNAGWFETAKGFIIGRSLLHDFEFDGICPRDAYKMFIEKKNLPGVIDVDLGHLAPMMPFVSGAVATIEVGDNSLSIDYGPSLH